MVASMAPPPAPGKGRLEEVSSINDAMGAAGGHSGQLLGRTSSCKQGQRHHRSDRDSVSIPAWASQRARRLTPRSRCSRLAWQTRGARAPHCWPCPCCRCWTRSARATRSAAAAGVLGAMARQNVARPLSLGAHRAALLGRLHVLNCLLINKNPGLHLVLAVGRQILALDHDAPFMQLSSSQQVALERRCIAMGCDAKEGSIRWSCAWWPGGRP